MAKLQEYNTVEEKELLFIGGGSKIQFNLNKLFNKLDEIVNKSNGTYVFRGVSEAKYMLYNSAQRHYITQELSKQVIPPLTIEDHYDSFISTLIDECREWNNYTVKKLLNVYNVNDENALAYLSYMQHYGVPTPLLDFTFNPYIALFFAIETLSSYPSNAEIDNYFSIYCIDSRSDLFELMWVFFTEQNIEYMDTGKINYKKLSENPLYLMSRSNEEYRIINNTNIINQQGTFFCNSNCFNPLEKVFADFVKLAEETLPHKHLYKISNTKRVAECINIHKSLVPAIKDKLSRIGITKEYIYPDTYKMKEHALHKATLRSLL